LDFRWATDTVAVMPRVGSRTTRAEDRSAERSDRQGEALDGYVQFGGEVGDGRGVLASRPPPGEPRARPSDAVRAGCHDRPVVFPALRRQALDRATRRPGDVADTMTEAHNHRAGCPGARSQPSVAVLLHAPFVTTAPTARSLPPLPGQPGTRRCHGRGPSG
jgi:hypothetical protein